MMYKLDSRFDFSQLEHCAGHLTGCGKKSQIMRKFESVLPGRFGQLRGKNHKLCGSFRAND